MMIKNILTLILFMAVISPAYSATVGNKNFSSGDSFKTSTGGNAYIITDKQCGQKYLVVTERFGGRVNGSTVAITPLIKPAVYVHEKGGK